MTDSNTGRIPRAPSTGGADRRRLTPIDIQQKEFRLAKFRGYNEREVDEFLDQVTDEVARLHADNKRLREELEARGTVRLDTGAVNEADDVVRRARDEAARIVGEAEADVARLRRDDASDAGGPTPRPAPVAPEDFLARERRVLQSMANLIQGHASAIKDELRRHREAARTGDTG